MHIKHPKPTGKTMTTKTDSSNTQTLHAKSMAAKADSKSSNPKTIWSTQSLVVPCSLLSLKILIFNKDRLSTVYPHSKLTVQISLVYAALPTGYRQLTSSVQTGQKASTL